MGPCQDSVQPHPNRVLAHTFSRSMLAPVPIASLLALVLVACSATETTSSTSRTSRPAASAPLAVLIQNTSDNSNYAVLLVSSAGRVVASVTARPRSLRTFYNPGVCPEPRTCHVVENGPVAVPAISASNSRVFYLDGDSDLFSVKPDGSKAFVSRLPGGPSTIVGFSVSPDNKRIAVSVMELTTSFEAPAKLQLYVEDLQTARHHRDLSSSTSTTQWPVGWRGNTLVLAVGDPVVGNFGRNPYGASSYRLIDSVTGKSTADLACVDGPLVAAGSACYADQVSPRRVGFESWEGLKTMLSGPDLGPAENPRLSGGPLLSPDGTQMAAAAKGNFPSQAPQVVLFSPAGESPTNVRAFPMGWLDSGHLLTDYCCPTDLRVLDVRTGVSVSVVASRRLDLLRFLGVLPPGLD